jgi:hypothetical protein
MIQFEKKGEINERHRKYSIQKYQVSANKFIF